MPSPTPRACGNMLAMPGLDSATIRHLLEVARRRGYSSVEVASEGEKLNAKFSPLDIDEDDLDLDLGALASVPSGPEEVNVTSPVVGYFRTSPKAVAVGETVEKGSVVGEIVALGLANDIVSPAPGILKEVLVSNGDAIEYGQVVAKVEKS